MQSRKDLETLFAALREAKILVGPREVLRIHEVLSRVETLDVNGLRSILVAILAKSREEKQKFDEIFGLFFQAPGALSTVEKSVGLVKPDDSTTGPDDEPEPPKPEPPVARRSLRRPLAVISGILLAALGTSFVIAKYSQTDKLTLDGAASASASGQVAQESASSQRDAGAPASSSSNQVADAGAVDRQPATNDAKSSIKLTITTPEAILDTRTYSTYVPRIDIARQYFLTSAYGIICGLGILTIVLGLVVFRWRMRLKILPPRAPAPTRSGPQELSLSAPEPRDLELLDMQSEDALVWGIGRFVTEEFTTTLNIEGSIAATVAAGGRPELRFERRGRHRQVCIWIDESAQDPAIERLGREISKALSRVGLEVEVARFWAVPDKLVRQDGTSFTAPSLEEELAFSIVAILTDGHALTTRHAGADRRFGISRLMRMFARLPRLAFVDFGEGPSRASRVARAYGITSVRPDEAAAFLALGRKPDVRDALTNKLTGDATAWAAACALGMRPVDEETAYDVRRNLGLSVTPWSWSVVRRSGRVIGDWVEWPLTKRAELLDWLRRAEHGAENVRVDPQSILGKTIAYWKWRLDTEAKVRKENDLQKPWTGTPAERTLRIERAFLDVWDEPELAAKILYSFVGTDAEDLVQEKLRDFAPLEAQGTSDVIVLPWRFDGLPEASRAMFERLGFGVDAGVRQAKHDDLVERRGRLWMGLGLACGLGIAVFVCGIRAWQEAEFRCVIENVEGCGGWCGQVENWNADGSRLVAGGLAGFSAQENAERTELPTLRFELQEVNCEAMTTNGWFVQRCGTKVPPEKPDRHGDPRRMLFVLQGSPADERVRSFGKTLLDRRVADVVLTISEGAGVGALNDWLPLFDINHDKLVMVRLQGDEVKPTSDSAALKFERYVASLPNKTRMWTLPDKPRRVWSDDIGSLAVAFDAADHVYAVDRESAVRQKKTSNFRPEGQQLPRFADLPENGETKWASIRPDQQAGVFVRSDGRVESSQGALRARLSVPGDTLIAPVIWNPQGSRFAGISSSGAVLWWNATETAAREFPTGNNLVPNALAWSLNGNELFVGTPDGVKMLAPGQEPITLSVTNQPISDIVGPVASKYLLISAKSGFVSIVGSNQTQQGPPSLEPIREIRALTGSISPDGNNVATVHEGGKVRIATIDNDITIDEFACDTTIAPAWSPDGMRLLVACGKTVYDRPVFSAMFGIKDVKGVCASREKLEKTFGMRSSEAAVMYSYCAPNADF